MDGDKIMFINSSKQKEHCLTLLFNYNYTC